MATFEVKEVCKSCSGTGLYKGMGEGKGVAVVCSTCNGTGCHEYFHQYEEFIERKERDNIKWVIQANPGIGVGEGEAEDGTRLKVSDFGGMPYNEWKLKMPFTRGMEMRKFTCPAWWYQCTDYKLKPHWKECTGCGAFSDCKTFKFKKKCWEKFDKENPV